MENVILCGIISEPKEPKLTMNSFIGLLVKELNDAYKRWMIPTKNPVLRLFVLDYALEVSCVKYQLHINYVAFLGHSAHFGCNKCLKEFPIESFDRKPDFSVYNRSDWEGETQGYLIPVIKM